MSITHRLQWLWKEWGKPLLLALVIVLPLRSSLADWYEVPTGSMKPTILEGDRVFVNKLAYDLKVPFTTRHLFEWDDPARGDVVVFPSPRDGTRLVKRVIGVPGDVIVLRNNHLLINNEPVRYEPIPPDAMTDLTPAQRAGRQFYREELAKRPHTVIFTPSAPAMRDFPPVRVPAGCYFVMGDNRDDSADSRYIGFVPRKSILGRATHEVLSFNYDRFHLPRLNRFLRKL